jgi:hypothetical protein
MTAFIEMPNKRMKRFSTWRNCLECQESFLATTATICHGCQQKIRAKKLRDVKKQKLLERFK